jgi:hypothetical protein
MKKAQGWWKGKSHLRAFGQLVVTSVEGCRLAGFNAYPKIFDALNPLIDILVASSDEVTDGMGCCQLFRIWSRKLY